jgi:hypothetical protein
MKKITHCILLLLAFCFVADFVNAQSGIYVGGHFRRDRPNTVNTLKASGFTYVILFNINVEPNGNLTSDGEQVCTNGVYVFGNTQPNYINDVNALKTGNTSINRIESCIGGWGNNSYHHIRDYINANGTGSNTNLYRNFQALKNAIPAMDAINNDDEHAYDVASATAFHVMLANIGFKTSLAPYTNKPYWQQLATNINNQRPGTVDRINIQCYDGGANNNPCDWNINNITLHAGLLHFSSTSEINTRMTNWRNSCNVKGGFLWVYNANDFNLQNYAGTINNVFGGGAVQNRPVTVHKDCNYGGSLIGLPVGDYTMTQLISRGVLNDDISSIQVASGSSVELFEHENFTGASIVITANNSCLVGPGWNDRATSLRVRSGCVSTPITPYLTINGGAWQQTSTATLNAGGSVTIGPHPLSGGSWSWTGPSGFTSTAREITRSNIQTTQAGIYTARYTNPSGCQSTQNFTINANGGSFTQTVQAENFSTMLGVATEACTEGGLNVGWIDNSDWMAYNAIAIPTTGSYRIEYRVASPNATGRLSLDLNAGAIQLGALTIPNTGGWQTWTTISHIVTINAGTYNVGIFSQTGGWNFNWWKITRVVSGRMASDESEQDFQFGETTEIQLWPNPTEDVLKIKTDPSFIGGQLRILDANSSEKISQTYNGDDVKVSHLPRGLHMLLIDRNGRRVVSKFFKK